MIIGVDAGALSVSDVRLQTGVWRVTLELIKVLSHIDTSNRYRLYSFAPISKHVMAEFGSTVENVVLSPSFGYMKIRLPLEIVLHPVDVFLGLSQIMPILSKSKKIGFIYDIGFLEHPDFYQSTAGKLTKQTASMARNCDQIITISNSVKNAIQHTYGLDSSRISVCSPGVQQIFRKQTKRMTFKYPYFLFVGSLRKGKNIPTLLRAYKKAITTGNIQQHLVLVGGDYWRDENIYQSIGDLGLSSRVHMVGHVSDSVLSRYYRGATAYVTTTLSEGFCIPVVEAMASQCPIIASDIRPIAETVRDAGILINPHDEKGFAGAMITMAQKTHVQKSYAKKGLIQSAMYTWENFGKGVYNVISHTTVEKNRL